ncbi:hypothetical protein VU07_04900 [Desulfobulbus sp. F4]|nr:hypothetical protein [Desulfobulbus sp. F4]
MAEFDYPNITSSEVRQVVEYLNQHQERRRLLTEAERGRKLLASKCAHCHPLDRVFIADMNEQRWNETIDDMVKIMGDPNYLSPQEKKEIVNFLSRRRKERRELWMGTERERSAVADGGKSLIARKCSAGCHALDRVLRPNPKKTRQEWLETINSMIEITGNPEYLSAEEKEQIINFLLLPAERRSKTLENKTDAQQKSSSADHPLINKKCGACHSLDRVHQVEKSKEEWEKTVSNMAEGTGDPNYLTEQEKKEIITIISSWEVLK